MLGTWKFSVGKYEEKIKFDKIWGYQTWGFPWNVALKNF